MARFKGGWSQAGHEQSVRAKTAAATRRGQNAVKAVKRGNEENKLRLEAAKKFVPRGLVSDGRILGVVSSIDQKTGLLRVKTIVYKYEQSWDPRRTHKC